MPTDKLELEKRVALTSPDYQVRGFNFSTVLALVEKYEGAQAATRLRGTLGRRLLGFFNYAAADYLRVLFEGADLLEGHVGGSPAAMRLMGATAARALLDTTVGTTLLNFLRGSDPMQMLKHLPTGYSIALSFGERTVVQVEDSAAQVIFEHDPLPLAYHEGVLGAGLDAVGLRCAIEGTSISLEACQFLVRWS